MTAENPTINPETFNKLIELASGSGKFSRDELEELYGLREKKDDPAHIEAEPPLLSDSLATFAEGTNRQISVYLKILGFDYYEYLLPRILEYAFALFGEQAISMLETMRPKQLIMKIVALILDRPRRDRLKVSLFETLEFTFSTPDQKVAAGFLYICPPDEILEAVWKLVERNEANFIRAWGRVPLLLKNQLTLTYLTSIEMIETLNVRLRSYISSMPMEIPSSPSTSGGVFDTGTDGSSALVSSEVNPESPSVP